MPPFSVIGPPARLAILTHSYVEPGRELHLRELVRLSGLAPRSVQQEVEKLLLAGLLAERRSGNRRYLRANKSHPLFRPIRDIVLKTTGISEVLREALGADGIESATIFGSIAGEQAAAGSDVDLLIIGPIGLREAVRRLGKAQDILAREINPIVWTVRELEKRRRTADPFLRRILSGPLLSVMGPPLNAAK